MSRKFKAIIRPKGIPQNLWIWFLNNKCSNCENPKGECTKFTATIKQAKKCFEEWLHE